MNNKVRLSVTIALILGAGVAAWQYLPSPSTSPSAQADVELPVVVSGLAELAEQGLSGEEVAELLADPRVEGYFKRRQDRQVLTEYFSPNGDGGGHDSEAVWQLIESIESEGRMLAYEAMALKLAWLERNSADKAEFDMAARELVEGYRQRAEQSAREYDPYQDVPGFAEYKEAEARIVREVQQMDSFPDGMSRQQYLRKRLQEAREEAYGE